MTTPTWTPTPKAEWVKVGDPCISAGGMRGTVIHLREFGRLLPAVTVRWENGHTGSVTITNVRRAV